MGLCTPSSSSDISIISLQGRGIVNSSTVFRNSRLTTVPSTKILAVVRLYLAIVWIFFLDLVTLPKSTINHITPAKRSNIFPDSGVSSQLVHPMSPSIISLAVNAIIAGSINERTSLRTIFQNPSIGNFLNLVKNHLICPVLLPGGA